MRQTLRRLRLVPVLARLLGLALAPAGGSAYAAAGTLSFEAQPDGRVSVIAVPRPDGSPETLVSEMGFELTPPNETRFALLPAVGRRRPRLLVGSVTYRLTVARYNTGGGTVLDFRAAPEAREARSAWEEREPIRVRLAARLGPSAMKGGRVILKGGLKEGLDGDRMVTLGPPEKLGPDVFPGNPGGSGDRKLHEKVYGRSVELYSVRGTRFYIETETPGEIEILKQDGQPIVRFAETLVDPGGPFAYAVFVGEEPYAGRPVLLDEPEARFVEDHACFEVGVRAFGAWSDPTDPADVALRLDGSDRLGYYTREFASVLERETEGGEAERLEPRGWPYFALRAPYSMSGNRIGLSFETTGGRARARVVLPTVNTREYVTPKRRLSGPTFGAPGPRGTAEVAEMIARLADEDVPAARFLAFETGWALTESDVAEIDLEAAWRLDRVIAEAGRHAVRLVIVHKCEGVPAELPEDARAAFRIFMRKLRYSEARWGAVRGFAASGIEALGQSGDGRVGYVRPARGRFEFAPHEVLSSRTHRGLWESVLACDLDVYTAPPVPLTEALALARFVSAVPELNCGAARQAGYHFAMRSGRAGALWYVETAQGGAGRDHVGDLDLCVDGLEPGRYRLEWWDPHAGRILTSTEIRTPGGTVDLVAPAFADEIAGRLVKLGQ